MITALPPIPVRGDPDFSSKADAAWSAMPTMVAEINAAIAAMNLNSTNSTSSTSMLIEVATKAFTVQASKSYVPGQTLKIAATASPTNWMLGDVTAYDVVTGLLTVAVQYKQGSGTYAAWTISQSAPVPLVIPSGSKTVWFQAVAPVGWTQITTYTGGYAMRVVSGVGGGTGGSVNFTTAFTAQAVTGSNSAVTLTTAQMPAHGHVYESTSYEGSVQTSASWINSVGNRNQRTSQNTGGGGSHNHTFTGTAIDLTVKYIDMLLASKD
jgi:hypothetical protein